MPFAHASILRLTHLPELPAQFQIPDHRFRFAALDAVPPRVLVRAEGIELRRSLGFRRRDQVPFRLSCPLDAQCHAPERAVSVMDGVPWFQSARNFTAWRGLLA